MAPASRRSTTAIEAVEHLVGLQAQLPNPPYVGLWSRLTDFRHDELTRLLYDRTVVRSSVLRGTQHLVSAADFRWLRPLVQPALDRGRQAAFGRRTAGLDLAELADVSRSLLAGRTLTRTEVRKRNFPTEFPFTTSIGLITTRATTKTLDKLLELSDDQETFEARREEAAARGKLLGRGLSTWVEVCGFVPSDVARHALGLTPGGWESSTVRMHPTGKVDGHHRHVPARPGPRDVVVADHRDRARRPVRRRRGDPRRHRLRPLRARHLWQPQPRGRRHGGAPGREQGARQGAPGRGADARGVRRRPRVRRRRVLGQGQPRPAGHDPGDRLPRMAGVRHARGGRARGSTRPSSSTRPTARSRSAPTAARSRSTATRARSRSPATSPSTTAATSSTR